MTVSDLDPVLDLGFDPSEKATKPYLNGLEAHMDLYEFLGTIRGHEAAAEAAHTVMEQNIRQHEADGTTNSEEYKKARYVLDAIERRDPTALKASADALRSVLGYGDSVYVAPNFLTLTEAATEGMPDFAFRASDLMVSQAFFYFARPVLLPFTSVEGDEVLDDIDDIWVRGVILFPVGKPEQNHVPLTEDTVFRITYLIHNMDAGLQAPNLLYKSSEGEPVDPRDYRWATIYSHQVAKGVRVTSYPGKSLKFFMALNLLMQQKIGYNRVVEPDRPLRRRKMRTAPNMGDIIVAHLRRRVPRDPEHEEWDETHEGPEWSHRWLVRGHWRNQWYPSENRHKPVWIMPFVKGPDDKPLIIKDRVVSADR